MRNKILITPLIALGLMTPFCVLEALAKPTLKTDREKLSYSLGVMTGQTFKSHGIELDAKYFALGFSDAMTGKRTLLTDQQIQQIVQDFQKQSQQRALAKVKNSAVLNLKNGEKFLENNKKRPGVITLKSGLQYKVIKMGSGPKPHATDTVVVDYEGRLIDGKVFDSSYERGQPASFPVNQVIQGWQEALQRMPVGSEWELYVPSQLAYGDANIPNIGPNQVLVFKIHLISIKK